MTRLVVDASVAAKWFLKDRADETHAEKAVAILLAARNGQVSLHQPPHFLAEVAAVLARLKQQEAQADLDDLLELEFHCQDKPSIYQCACQLAIRLNHHLFDTLYHAVALNLPETTLITADEAYYRKARSLGGICMLHFLPAERPFDCADD